MKPIIPTKKRAILRFKSKQNKGNRYSIVVEDEKEDEDDDESEEEEQDDEPFSFSLSEEQDSGILSLYGHVEEKRAEYLTLSLLSRLDRAQKEDKELQEVRTICECDCCNKQGATSCTKEECGCVCDPCKRTKEEPEDIKMVVSTGGGSIADMFSIYDAMTLVKQTRDIETFGLGKVMSAGVLIMAAGTKGKRKIGRNCRIMLHSVQGGAAGSSHDVVNEIGEMSYLEGQYLECIAQETGMSVKKLKKIIDRKVNSYFTAKEAVEMGIADVIV
jgi:ATP-dependent Clp endopeptidase proteolytic subunit ClpP